MIATLVQNVAGELRVELKSENADEREVAGWWAVNNELAWRESKADWKKHGKAAGPIRNSEMAKVGTHLLLIHTGSRGSLDMKRKALAARMHVTEYIVGPPEEWPSDWVEVDR